MRFPQGLMATASMFAVMAGTAQATDFDRYGQAPQELVAIQPTPNFIVELGMGLGTAPAYEGASDYKMTFDPIIDVERLIIPGLIEINGDDGQGGFGFAPSVSIASERISGDHEALTGLDDVDATYAVGARIGYEMIFTDAISAEIYGAARWAFGGAEGLIGEVGVDVTAKLTPELEIVGGPVVNFASENYMDTYFGVTGAEAVASGGRLEAFDPSGGIKSVGLKVAARYEFIEDTFLNVKASYSTFVGDALNSPIVASGSEQQFTIGMGLSRRFSF